METIRVILFEDNRHLRESLGFLLSATPGFELAGAFPDCNGLNDLVREHRPDVVLMDIEMPGLNGIEGVKLIKKEFPTLQVLMQTIFHDDDTIFRAICAGASGYILKSTTPTGYLDAIRDVFNGGSPMTGSIARRVLALFQQHLPAPSSNDYKLTAKEKEILQYMIQGKSFKMIADASGIAYETVRTHTKNIYSKLHVNSNTEAVSKAINERIV